MVLIGRPVSAVRAGYFWSFAILALRLSRLIPLPTIILATIVVMASFNPLVLGDVSFQLSVGAVIGIGLALFLTQPLVLPDHLVNIKTVALSTLGATILTGPIIAYWFGTISFLGLPANLVVVPLISLMFSNLVVVPLISLMFLLMVVSVPISFVVPPIASLITFVVHVLWVVIYAAINWLAAVPYGYMQNVTPSMQFIIGYYVALVAVITWILWKQKRTWREIWQ
jgi:competence protein ComEC